MSIENVSVRNIRPKGYLNLARWIADSRNVYIGRTKIVFIDGLRYPKIESPFANPYKIGIHGTRAEVMQKYRTYMIYKLNSSTKLQTQLLALKGKTLGCWCYPEYCHGNVLLELIPLYEYESHEHEHESHEHESHEHHN